jgi:hypothetical protein
MAQYGAPWRLRCLADPMGTWVAALMDDRLNEAPSDKLRNYKFLGGFLCAAGLLLADFAHCRR